MQQLRNTPMRCLTGSEASTEALARRLERASDLHEVRLDLLDRVDGDTFDLLRRHAPKLVVTCRAAVEGGGFRGSEPERLDVLRRAARTGVAWLDLELFLFEQGAVARLDLQEVTDPPRLLASYHDFEGGAGRPEHHARRFDGCPADLAKLAVAVGGPQDLLALRELEFGCEQRVVIGMGMPGVWSRLRPADFGSSWTYLTTTSGRSTAPGQLTSDDALAMRLAEHAQLEPLALIGDATIQRSPGPRVYNELLRQLDLPYQYLPLASEVTPQVADLVGLGVAGVSVAAPFKASMLAACQELDPWARRSHAVNTIRRLADGRWKGWNTDAPAVLSLLGDELRAGDRAVVLGSGATAGALAGALSAAGAEVALASRRGRRGFEADYAVVDWARLEGTHPDVIVHCTPMGGDDDLDPWPHDIDARVVLDLVLRPDGPTRLVRRARERGCRTHTGHDLWCHQGALQMSLLLDREITVEHLEGILASSSEEI